MQGVGFGVQVAGYKVWGVGCRPGAIWPLGDGDKQAREEHREHVEPVFGFASLGFGFKV